MTPSRRAGFWPVDLMPAEEGGFIVNFPRPAERLEPGRDAR